MNLESGLFPPAAILPFFKPGGNSAKKLLIMKYLCSLYLYVFSNCSLFHALSAVYPFNIPFNLQFKIYLFIFINLFADYVTWPSPCQWFISPRMEDILKLQTENFCIHFSISSLKETYKNCCSYLCQSYLMKASFHRMQCNIAINVEPMN